MSDPRKSSLGTLNDYFDSCVNRLLGDDASERRCLAVTAGHFRAGVSTVSLQLAFAFARRFSEPVALVDANLRRPSLHAVLGLERRPGFTNLMSGELRVDKIAHHSSRDPDLDFITVGDPIESPLQFFESTEFGEQLKVLDACYRVVVFDCPALGVVPEAEILIGRVGSAVLVVEAESTRWEVAQRMRDLLVGAHVEIAGVILNRKRHLIPNSIYRLL